MSLLLQSTGQAPGGGNQVSGKQGEASASSDFSRLLARQNEGAQVNRTGKEHSAVNERRDGGRDDSAGESGKIKHPDTDSSPGSRPGNAMRDSHATSMSPEEGTLMGPSLSWASMPGFPGAIETLGMLNISGPALEGMEAIPADAPARLGGEIAARFTDRNGMQTLTLKLDPDHLGRVEVRLQARGDQLSIRLLADNREAETALRQNLRELTDAIVERTGKYQQVDVRVELKPREDPGAGNTDRETPQDDARRHNDNEPQGNWRDEHETTPEEEAQGG